MSLSLCLYVCCKHRPLHQNQIFKIPITFCNARRQQSSRTVELVDHTHDCRRVARRTHMSVDRNALTALLRSRMGLLCTLFLQLCSSWQDSDWYSVSCSLSVLEELLGYSWYRGNVQTPGPLVLWLSDSKSIVPRHLSIAQVLSQLWLPDFLKTLFWENVNGCLVVLLLLILYNTPVSVTELSRRTQIRWPRACWLLP